MNRSGVILLTVVLASTLTAGARSLESKTASTVMAPEMQKWSFLLGEWKMNSKRYSLEGPVIEENSGKARFSLTLGGLRIQEHHSTTLAGQPMTVLNVFTFHPEKKEWEIARTDSLHHLFSLMGGEGSGRSIVLYERNPDPEDEVIRRVTYSRLGDDRFSRLLEFSLDDGKSWLRRNETLYSRSR